jgi:ATP-dependent Lon protease
MPACEDFSFSAEQFSGIARLFPLPNLVLFPHVMQPLHIFEPRYCELFREALAGDRLIAMAVLAPGWEADYEGRPPLYPTACLGRIAAHHRLPDGSYNLLLTGLKRVEIVRELPPVKTFREAEVKLCEDSYPDVPAEAAEQLRRRFHEAFMKILPALVKTHGQVAPLTEGDMPLGVLTDIIGYMLDIPLADKQTLLAESNVHRRAEVLLEHLARAAADTKPGAAGALEFPPAFSEN